MDTLFLFFLISLPFCLLGLSWFAGSDAPYVPTKIEPIKQILKLAGVGPEKVFYELGSGDGRVVLEAAKLGAESYGIEQSWLRVWLARLKARQAKLPKAHFFHGDIFQRQYFPAQVVYIYLLQKAVDKLESKLTQELTPRSFIITQTYHFKNLKPLKKEGNFWIYEVT